ncbi:MAG TPA: MarR family transcriptional regulator [Rhizomicrobium sp.]|nr:MarR family transcriptional regulator [Rhizomicrobium sp.]
MRPFYRATHYGMKNSVGYLIRRSNNLIQPQMEALFAAESLTFSQWTVLMALRELGRSTAVDLARNICHDAGSLTRILDELEERGLVTRARSETDRREVALTLTAKGLGMVETLLPGVVDFWNGLLGDFSHLEIKLLVKLLGRLVDAADGQRAEPRRRRGFFGHRRENGHERRPRRGHMP